MPEKNIAKSSSNLFFIEIIVSLLFFCISGAVILHVFAVADSEARKSSVSENVILSAQSAAEAYSYYGNVPQTLKAVFERDFPPNEDGSYTIFLNEKCLCESGADDITLMLNEISQQTVSGILSQLDMTFVYNGEEIYTLSCSAYIPNNESA